MLKKLITFVLSMVLFVSLLGGCTLVALDNNKEMSQAVAVIAARTHTYREDGESKTYTYKERVITKAQLINAFEQQAQSYAQQNNGASILQAGYKPQELMDNLLENLVDRQLFLREAEFLKDTGKITIRQKDINAVWKQIYANIDNYIYTQEQNIAKDFGEEIYDKGTTETPTPEFPDREDYYTDNDEDEITPPDEAKWTPERVLYPETLETESEIREAARKVQGLRRFVNYLKEIVDSNKGLLSPEEKTKYEADLKELEEFESNNITPAKYSALYAKLMDMWMIDYVFYQPSYEEMLFNKFQDYFVKAAKDKLKESKHELVQGEYDKVLARQKELFKDLTTYNTARGNLGSENASEYVILYDPVGAQPYYTKHILLPFNEDDTAKDSMDRIRVYERDIYGRPMTEQGHKTVNRVYQEVSAALRGKNSLLDIDRTFTDYIFKYNTDPGIFNNKLGYGPKELEGFVEEFKTAAKELYDDGNGKPGALSKPVMSSHGAHIIMLSLVVEPGQTKTLSDYTDATESISVFNEIYSKLVKSETDSAMSEFQYSLRDKKSGSWKEDIKTYPRRYKDLVKNLSSQMA